MDASGPIHLAEWIAANATSFAPPVSNREVFPGSDVIFMVIRGPNARSDFHVDPYDEIFIQIEGTIAVDLRTEAGAVDRHLIGPGEIMRVPGGTPHAPHRPAGSWGIVIERPRGEGEVDELVWYCDACGSVVHRTAFALADIETELAAAIGAFNASVAMRTCSACGTVAPVPEPFVLP